MLIYSNKFQQPILMRAFFSMITQPYGSRADFLIRVDTIHEARDIDWQRITSGEARGAVVVVREHWASASASARTA